MIDILKTIQSKFLKSFGFLLFAFCVSSRGYEGAIASAAEAGATLATKAAPAALKAGTKVLNGLRSVAKLTNRGSSGSRKQKEKKQNSKTPEKNTNTLKSK